MGPLGPPRCTSTNAAPRPAPRRPSVDRGRAPPRPRARAGDRLPGGPDLHALRTAVGAASARRGRGARLRGGARGDRHPGAARARLLPAQPGGAGRIAARSLGEVLEACRGFTATIALDNTAGQGTQIGWRFEQLGRLSAEARGGERLRVCLDTEHAFAAGYDLRSAAGYAAALAER